MTKNIGTTDRILRFIIGLVCFGFAYFIHNTYGTIAFGTIGVFAIIQAALGWCALYALLDICTYSAE